METVAGESYHFNPRSVSADNINNVMSYYDGEDHPSMMLYEEYWRQYVTQPDDRRDILSLPSSPVTEAGCPLSTPAQSPSCPHLLRMPQSQVLLVLLALINFTSNTTTASLQINLNKSPSASLEKVDRLSIQFIPRVSFRFMIDHSPSLVRKMQVML